MIVQGNSTPSKVTQKAYKAGQILQVENIILRTELAEQKAYKEKKDTKSTQKQKRVPCNSITTVGKALEAMWKGQKSGVGGTTT